MPYVYTSHTWIFVDLEQLTNYIRASGLLVESTVVRRHMVRTSWSTLDLTQLQFLRHRQAVGKV